MGRLDRDTEGLVLLTTNGQLGYELLHPNKKVPKRYDVIVNGPVTAEDVAAFAQGIVFHGGVVCQPAKLTIEMTSGRRSFVHLEIAGREVPSSEEDVFSKREKSDCPKKSCNWSFGTRGSIVRRIPESHPI